MVHNKLIGPIMVAYMVHYQNMGYLKLVKVLKHLLENFRAGR